VCQNQSIDDSDAPLARDLRLLVRERLKAGDSDEQVVAFIVDRYGEFVLLKPPFKASTLILWLLPLVALCGGAWLAYASLAARQPASTEARAPSGLTAEEQRRLNELLQNQSGDKS
jgi:cytochrome c-type biogenesis protein CcmH